MNSRYPYLRGKWDEACLELGLDPVPKQQTKQSKAIVQEKLVVGYWELIPMESGDELSAP